MKYKYNYNLAATTYFVLASLTVPSIVLPLMFRGNVVVEVASAVLIGLPHIYCLLVFQDMAQRKFGGQFNKYFINVLIYLEIVAIALSPLLARENEAVSLFGMISIGVGLVGGITSLLFGLHILDFKNIPEKDKVIWKTYAILRICLGAIICSIILIVVSPLILIPLYIVSGLIIKREDPQSDVVVMPSADEG